MSAPSRRRDCDMDTGPRTTFLERANYRQRRFRDAARWLPVFAIILMLLPVMWPRENEGQSLTSSGMIYLFGLWVVVVAFAFALSRVLHLNEGTDPEDLRRKRPSE